eukprot:TRINITY_DN6787_c0_g1_i1.p1 TRINITY_DN6787_c0_g1~~TRINITY_DN6787_c0_g1_i1.p1  ORF type:complete len:533 (+),score=70.96 TRINITY_DN6787_c0_g1_i1:123-1721(+)
MRQFFGVVFVVSAFLWVVAAQTNSWYSLTYDAKSDKYNLIEGKHDQRSDVVGIGKYDDTIETKGWSQLWVDVLEKPHFNDHIRAFAAGFLEGALTHKRIYDYFRNIQELGKMVIWGDNLDNLEAWLDTQQNWTRTNVAKLRNSSPYWDLVGLIDTQVDGIVAGYNYMAPATHKLSHRNIILINSLPDSMDLVNVVNKTTRPDWLHLSTEEAIRTFHLRTHCSALIKPLMHEQFAGHTTWVFYSMLVRVYKYINLPFSNAYQRNPLVSFSSYPAQIVSADDFYTIGEKFAVIETSNEIFNHTLYDLVTPSSLLSWQRTALANRAAKNGKTWADTFRMYNSGTYNNQWMFYNFEDPIEKLWIAEQIPGLVEAQDVSAWLLQHGYWASYNIPYFSKVYSASGYGEMQKKHGNQFSWELCPRARIFRRNESMVHNLEDMKNLMRYNNFHVDKLEDDNPMWAIASRADLTKENPMPFGGLDSKITSDKMKGSAVSICGPSRVDLPAFSWEGDFDKWPHYGQPKTFAFDWMEMKSHSE